MSLQTRLGALITAVGADIKADRARLTALEAQEGDILQPGVVGAADLGQYQAATASQMFIEAGVVWAFVGSVLTRFVVPRTTVSGFSNTSGAQLRFDKVVFDPADGTVKRIAGTAQNGVTMANRLGEGTTPTNGIILYDLVITTSGISTGSGNLRNRKPWARGFYHTIRRTSNAAAANNYTSTATTPTLIDATNLNPRFECSGKPVRMTISGSKGVSVANHYIKLIPWMDGANAQTGETDVFSELLAGTADVPFSLTYPFTPPAGSHQLGWAMASDVGTNTVRLLAQAGFPLYFEFEELIRQNANNGSA